MIVESSEISDTKKPSKRKHTSDRSDGPIKKRVTFLDDSQQAALLTQAARVELAKENSPLIKGFGVLSTEREKQIIDVVKEALGALPPGPFFFIIII